MMSLLGLGEYLLGSERADSQLACATDETKTLVKRNSAKILVLGPHLYTRINLCTCHDWPVKNAIVKFAI